MLWRQSRRTVPTAPVVRPQSQCFVTWRIVSLVASAFIKVKERDRIVVRLKRMPPRVVTVHMNDSEIRQNIHTLQAAHPFITSLSVETCLGGEKRVPFTIGVLRRNEVPGEETGGSLLLDANRAHPKV